MASPANPEVEVSLAPPFAYAGYEAAEDELPTPPPIVDSAEESSEDDDAPDGCTADSPSLPTPDKVLQWQAHRLHVLEPSCIDRDSFKNRGPPLA